MKSLLFVLIVVVMSNFSFADEVIFQETVIEKSVKGTINNTTFMTLDCKGFYEFRTGVIDKEEVLFMNVTRNSIVAVKDAVLSLDVDEPLVTKVTKTIYKYVDSIKQEQIFHYISEDNKILVNYYSRRGKLKYSKILVEFNFELCSLLKK